MKYIFVMILLVSAVAIQLLPAEARSSSEPCSYLTPSKFVRDANGNCVLADASQNTVTESPKGYSQARSSSEPCSYLNPSKFYRDSNGNCMLVPIPQKDISTNSITQSPVSVNTVSQNSFVTSSQQVLTQDTKNTEPCHVFNPSEYTRDENGNCILIQKTNPTQNIQSVNFDPQSSSDFGQKFPSKPDSPESLVAIFSVLGIIGIGFAKLYQKKLSKASRRQRQWRPVEKQMDTRFSDYVRRKD
jgi:hypothetical protein